VIEQSGRQGLRLPKIVKLTRYVEYPHPGLPKRQAQAEKRTKIQGKAGDPWQGEI
jgi:hypothetical protein